MNVLMYAHDITSGAKHERAKALVFLYSEDLADGQIYGSVRVVNPLRAR
jgi:predicted nucleic acid-binding protein